MITTQEGYLQAPPKTPVIKAHALKAWLELLGSGRYTQRSGFLRMGGKFSSLGLLCEAANLSGVGRWYEPVGFGGKPYYPLQDPTFCFAFCYGSASYNRIGDIDHWCLPNCVVQWAGLLDCSARTYSQVPPFSSIAAIDSLQTGFLDIANVIEKKFKVI